MKFSVKAMRDEPSLTGNLECTRVARQEATRTLKAAVVRAWKVYSLLSRYQLSDWTNS